MVVVAEREVEAGAVDLRAHAEHGDVRVGGAARGDETDEMRKRLAGRDRRGRVTARSHSKRQYDRRKGASCRHHSPFRAGFKAATAAEPVAIDRWPSVSCAGQPPAPSEG